MKPERATIRRATEQPGQIEAFEVTAIYAKVSGYVEKWTVDIGAKVKKNQVLALLGVPELDAEAEQKQAMVEESEAKRLQAQASEDVARANLAAAAAKLTEVLRRNRQGRRRPRSLAVGVQTHRAAFQGACANGQPGRRNA